MSMAAENTVSLGPHPQYPKSVKAGIPKLSVSKPGWKKRPIGELFDVVTRPVDMQDETVYNLVTVKRSRGGVIEREKLPGKKIAVKSQFYVEAGDFLISKRQIVHGACGFVPAELNGYIVSNEYSVLQCKDTILPEFLSYLMHTPYFQQTCFHSSIGVHVEKMIFKLDDWFKWKINLPSEEEQQQIATFLSSVDDKANKLRCKRELLETYKYGLMQKLFSQKTRFKQDDGSDFSDWKERKLGLISTILRGKGLPKDSVEIDGKYKCILYGELFTKYKAVIGVILSATNVEDGTLGKCGDILMPTSDVTPYGLATASVLSQDNVRIGGDINIVRSNPKINSVYLSHLLNFSRKPIVRLVTGTTVKHIYAKDIESLIIRFPNSGTEQKKIACLLSTFDEKIDLIDKKISQLETYKKGLLKNIFV